MVKKGDLVIAILITFCLTATLFLVKSTKSQSTASNYDPWADANGDGVIDMYDVGYTASMFLSTGDPTKNVNVTNWPTTQPEPAYQSYDVYLNVYAEYDSGAISQDIPVYGYSRMFLSIEIVNASGIGTPATTVSLILVGWNDGHGGFESVPQSVLNATFDGYSLPVYSQQVPAEFSTKNSYCTLVFFALCPNGGANHIGFYVHVYLRNE